MGEIVIRRTELAGLEFNPDALEATIAGVLDQLYAVWDEVPVSDQDAIQNGRRALLRALAEPDLDDEQATRLLIDFLQTLEQMDSVVRLAYHQLKAGKITQTLRSGGARRGDRAATAMEVIPGAPPTGNDPLLDTGEVMPYHTKVDFPPSISSRDGSAHPLVVQLVINRPAQSRSGTALAIPFIDEATPELVEVHLTAPGFEETTGIHRRTLVIYKGDDSEPAIFLLKLLDRQSGHRELRLDFYHLGYPVGSATFKTEVSLYQTGGVGRARPAGRRPAIRTGPRPLPGHRPGSPAPQPRPQEPENLGTATLVQGVNGLEFAASGAEPPDVILRVVRDADDKTLHFKLISPRSKIGYRQKEMGSVVLQRLKDPTLLLGDYFADLDQMARNANDALSDADVQDYVATTEGIGNDLYAQLFSDELKAEYWRLRELRRQGAIHTLLILSDEPWIPWEMVYPFDDEHGADDFLAAAWQLARWQAGRGLNPTLDIETVQVIAPDLDLSFVEEETNYFAQLRDAPRPVTVEEPITSRRAFLDRVQAGGTQLLHFATHGNFNSQNADRSPIYMEGGETIAPVDLSLPRTQGIRRERPIVFLNACHGGKLEFTLTGIGGWAERMVNHVAATAFIGAYWEIDDRLASLFSRTFYEALRQQVPLAAAFHQARMGVRAASPANPTWLAYTLYGDPNAHIGWAEDSNR